VKIRALDQVQSKVDPVFRTSLNRKVRAATYEYNAQINLGKKAQDRKERVDTGDRTSTRGWLVLRTHDLAAASSPPKPEKGWKIVAIYVGTDQEQEVDYLIEEVRHESPYRGRPLLVYLDFEQNREKARGVS
jgi:hypothetical protein